MSEVFETTVSKVRSKLAPKLTNDAGVVELLTFLAPIHGNRKAFVSFVGNGDIKVTLNVPELEKV